LKEGKKWGGKGEAWKRHGGRGDLVRRRLEGQRIYSDRETKGEKRGLLRRETRGVKERWSEGGYPFSETIERLDRGSKKVSERAGKSDIVQGCHVLIRLCRVKKACGNRNKHIKRVWRPGALSIGKS